MEEQITYHIVDSVKGGSGKTTFSIMFAQYLHQVLDLIAKYGSIKKGREAESQNGQADDKEQSGKNLINSPVCLFDMDFIGTGLWNLFYAEREGDYLGNLNKFKEQYIFVNQMIRSYRTDGKQYFAQFKVAGWEFNIAFSSPEQKDKDEYIFAAMQNYTMALQYGTLKTGIYHMLDREQIAERIKTKPGHIILDMAPGNDNYSQAVKQIFFDRDEESLVKKNDQLNYYLLVGMDQGQVVAAANYLRRLLGGNEKLPDKIFVVFNDAARYLPHEVTQDNIPKNGKHFNSRKNMFVDILNIGSVIHGKNRICFLALNEFEEYSKLMLKVLVLPDADGKVFLETPFAYYAAFEEDMQKFMGADTEEKIWNWIQPES